MKFAGYMPIGAAINGTTAINSYISNANNKGFYVIHGGNDSPSSRYTPLINGLTTNGAILNSKLMPGVGHTIDFPNRDQILTDAFMWLDSVRTTQLSSISLTESSKDLKVYPTILDPERQNVRIEVSEEFIGQSISVYHISGAEVSSSLIKNSTSNVEIPNQAGTYFVVLGDDDNALIQKIIRN
jgi:hypothetical protein